MGWLRKAAAASGGALLLGLGVLQVITPIPTASAAVPVTRDGSTAATAAASCWEIKQNFPTKPSGAYWLQTPKLGAPQRFFCEQDMQGGGWVMLGRGRDGWGAQYGGQGDPNALLTRTRQPNQFAPVQLSSTTVDGLLNGGRVDALPDGIMLHRATNLAGTTYSAANFSMQRDRWVWSFGASHPIKWSRFDSGAQNPGGTSNNFGINATTSRVVTSPLPKNNYRIGWGYGTGSTGSPAADAYMWSPTSGDTPLPYAEVYIRPKLASNVGYTAIPNTGLPATTKAPIASSFALKGNWGVTTPIVSTPGEEGNVPVQAFEQINNIMYVGGNFSVVQRGSAATESFPQKGLAAFNATTGEPIRTFKPVLNGPVRSLLKLPNGLLMIGGDFTQVNGRNLPGVATINPNTGAIAAGWTAFLQNRIAPGVVRVRDLELGGNYVYVSGMFTHIGKSATSAMNYTRNAARIYWPTATPDTWNPEFSGTVYDGEVSDNGGVFWAAGWFDRSKNVPTYRAAAISTDSGARLMLDSTNKFVPETWSRPSVSPGYQQTVKQYGNRVYFGGSEHSLFGFATGSLNRVSGTITNPGGDFQASTLSKGVLYAGCHCNNWSFENSFSWPPEKTAWTQADKISWFGAWDAATGRQIPGFNPPNLRSSNAGAWELFTATDGTIWAGGDFTGAMTGPSSSQWVGGFVRFPEIDTTAPTAPTNFKQLGNTATTVAFSWAGPTGVQYEVLRDDRVVATVDGTTVTVPRGGNDRFFVRAVDSEGNRSATTPVLVVTETGPVPGAWVARNATWSYYDAKAAPAANWFRHSFNAGTWSTGQAPLGWGGNDIATNLDKPSTDRARAMYFRNQVNIPSLAGVTQVTLSVVADDGAVVFVNGQELGRVRMPSSVPNSTVYANAAISYANANSTPLVLDVPLAMLMTGSNTIAVETHLNYLGAPSASVAATLTDTTRTQTSPAPAAPTNVQRAGSTASTVDLTWQAVSGAAYYEVLRDGYVMAATSTPKATVAIGGSNSFTVRAVTQAGRRSAPSAPFQF